MQETLKPITSHASIIGIFITLTIILSIPLFIFASSEKQDIRQKASGEGQNADTQSGSGYISGYIFNDENKNGIREYNEPGAARINVDIIQTNKYADENTMKDISTTLISDDNGYFKYDFAGLTNQGTQPLSFDILIDLPDGYKTVNTNPIRIDEASSDAHEIFELGIFQY